VGKTSWAAESPTPLFICGDEVSELNVDRLPQVKSWDEFKSQLKWVLDTKPDYGTIVVDTIDYMERLLHRHILDGDQKANGIIGAACGGYGKSFDKAVQEMTDILENYIKPIRDLLGMNVIVITHSKKSQVTDVLQTMTYETHDMCLHQKVQAVWCEWVSGIFFADFITYKTEGENTSKTFLTGDGERVLYTTKKPGHFGKNRWNLPESLPLEFAAFYKLFLSFYDEGVKPDALIAQIMSLSENIKDADLKAKIVKNVESANGDIKKLQRYLQRIQEITRS